MIDNIEINGDFRKALDLMENSTKSLLITGRAGTGKSTLLRYFKEHTKKSIVVCAPTGLAALNVGGQTIHSLFRLPPKILDDSDIRMVYNGIYKEIDVIIIDEISMVRADLFDAIDMFMRLNGKDSMKPFGGAQLFLFGDLYQLPPVVENEMGAIMRGIYASPYFFDSKVMKHFSFEVINLEKVYRQKDPIFVEFLDKVRLGDIDSETLELVNNKVNKAKEESIIVTPTNRVANFINYERLNRLPETLHTYKAKIEGDFNIGVTNLPVDLELNLKKGAKVIFVKNDTHGRWVNGTLGIVEELNDCEVKVRLNEDLSIVSVGTVDWDKIKYEYDRFSKRIIAKVSGTLTQIPLKLAWALTIHKCQGQSLDSIHIDLSSGVWEFGHVYVALSRCRTLEGVGLETKIKTTDIKVDYRVSEFLNKISKQSRIPLNYENKKEVNKDASQTKLF